MGIWYVTSDACGIFSASLTVALVLYAQIVIIKVVLLPWYGMCWHVLFYSICSVLAIVAHTRAQFTDPGCVPTTAFPKKTDTIIETLDDGTEQEVSPRTCKRCSTIKPSLAHHCGTCGRCVIRMDHHCPWVNNCVAIFNQKYFVLFLFYTALCCIYSGVLLVARFVSCTHNLRQCSVSGGQAAMCVVNFVEALVFGLFVIIMLFDQFAAIFDNSEHARYDDEFDDKGKKRTKYMALKEVFGEPLSWRWLLPLNLPEQLTTDFENELARYEMKTKPVLGASPSSSAR